MRLFFIVLVSLASVFVMAQEDQSHPMAVHYINVNIPNEDGQSNRRQIELETIEINSIQDMATAIAFMQNKLQSESPVHLFKVVDQTRATEELLGLKELTNKAQALTSMHPQSKYQETALSGQISLDNEMRKAKQLNLVFTFSRFIVNSVVISTSLVITNVSPMSSMMMGLLIGSLSASTQWKGDWLSEYTRNAYWLVKKFRSLNGESSEDFENLSKLEKILSGTERPIRILMIDSAFNAIVWLGMKMASIPMSKSYFETVLSSWLSGGAFSLGVNGMTSSLLKKYPHLKGKIKMARDSAFFSASVFGNIALILSSKGVSIGEAGLYLIGSTGIVLLGASKVIGIPKVEAFMDRWMQKNNFSADSKVRCSGVYAL